ncbi:MAG: hypothetical protein A3G24_22155, partial [Betaproteobacteria bacterium RIFCSPLOWO2_12_FULL_62_13]
MEKLIITCCVFREREFWGPPEARVNMPKTIREVADSIRGARDAGAAVVHVHVPETTGGSQNSPFIREKYLELLRLIRQTDVIYEYRGPGPFQCGYAGRKGTGDWETRLKEWREIDLGDDKPDMVVCILGAQHWDGGETQHYVMPTLPELESHMKYMLEKNVKPEFEVWGANSMYNLKHLIKKQLVKPPYWLELFLGASGSTSSPANLEELLYMTKRVPE